MQTLINKKQVQEILSKCEIEYPIDNLDLYQRAFIHKSYCEMKDYEEYDNPDNCLELFKISYETLEFIGDSF